ncbi:proton-conducting transporter membrane subunit [Prochlorococcus sp. MIT 1306]|uniref:proton-conducting transporter transmembrane domain-containing protein n=1 Tax=Prochlorococcus sp. MIT 1306 TaxID=1799667 RepID=UPI0007B391F2|nr:proton-conducting transporter membrane subunit [Prochlorococcus sp. MIT 1306]KZR66226.1 NADH-quinone oxidoreductase subunit L [Prochlorococcus sp. MIT 1306]
MPLPSELAWLIPVLPLAGACFVGFLLISFKLTMNRLSKPVSFLLVSCVGAAAVLSYALLAEQRAGTAASKVIFDWPGLTDLNLQIGFVVDGIGAEMLALISTAGMLLMLSAHIYMVGKKNYVSFFTYLGFFTSALLGLALSPNLLEMFVFWLLVGISSSLLVGFWYDTNGSSKTTQNIFLVDRLGDVGFLLGSLGLFWVTRSFGFDETGSLLEEAIVSGKLSNPMTLLLCLLMIMGPIAKLIEFPLYIWRPDVLKAPVPVSALIHATTLVAAGVFVVARIEPVLAAGASALPGTVLANLFV